MPFKVGWQCVSCLSKSGCLGTREPEGFAKENKRFFRLFSKQLVFNEFPVTDTCLPMVGRSTDANCCQLAILNPLGRWVSRRLKDLN
jgi:hypothetical protein